MVRDAAIQVDNQNDFESNSNEKYDYTNLGPLLILSFVLFSGWILALPARMLYIQFFSKQG